MIPYLRAEAAGLRNDHMLERNLRSGDMQLRRQENYLNAREFRGQRSIVSGTVLLEALFFSWLIFNYLFIFFKIWESSQILASVNRSLVLDRCFVELTIL